MMLKNTLIVTVLLAGFLGGLLFYQKGSYSEKLSADGALPQSPELAAAPGLEHEPNESAANTNAPSQSGHSAGATSREIEANDQLRTIRKITNAQDANAYFDALSSLELIDPELAVVKRRDLDDFCSNFLLETDTESVHEKRQIFCKGYLAAPLEADDLAKRAGERSVFEVSQADIEYRLEEAQKEGESTEVFTQLVLRTKHPQQIHSLINQNTQGVMRHHIWLWQLGEEIQRERYPSADLLKGQTVALLLYQCMKFGGCGSTQYFSVIYCSNFLAGRCASTATVEEMLYQTTPPADFNLANEILSRLLTLHRNSKGS